MDDPLSIVPPSAKNNGLIGAVRYLSDTLDELDPLRLPAPGENQREAIGAALANFLKEMHREVREFETLSDQQRDDFGQTFAAFLDPIAVDTIRDVANQMQTLEANDMAGIPLVADDLEAIAVELRQAGTRPNPQLATAVENRLSQARDKVASQYNIPEDVMLSDLPAPGQGQERVRQGPEEARSAAQGQEGEVATACVTGNTAEELQMEFQNRLEAEGARQVDSIGMAGVEEGPMDLLILCAAFRQ